VPGPTRGKERVLCLGQHTQCFAVPGVFFCELTFDANETDGSGAANKHTIGICYDADMKFVRNAAGAFSLK
jgi:hypothetical protein